VLSGCTTAVSKSKYTALQNAHNTMDQNLVECTGKLKGFRLAPEEADYENKARVEVPRFEDFLQRWAQDFANLMTSGTGTMIKVHVKEFVFLDGFNNAVVRSVVSSPDNIKDAVDTIAVMIKNDDGEWKFINVVWFKKVTLESAQEDDTDEEL